MLGKTFHLRLQKQLKLHSRYDQFYLLLIIWNVYLGSPKETKTFQQGNQTHGFKIKSDDYEIAFKILLQMKVTDRNRQRPVRRRVLHHDQTTFKLLQVIDDSPDRPDGVTSLRTIFDVLSLLPKTAKAPHYSSPLFPGTDCLICPWPVPPAYQLEAFLGPAFIQSAVSYILQNFLTGPPAYHCWILPSTWRFNFS